MSGAGTFTRLYDENESPIVSIATTSPRVAWIGLANGHHYRLDWADESTLSFPSSVTSLGTSEVNVFASD